MCTRPYVKSQCKTGQKKNLPDDAAIRNFCLIARNDFLLSNTAGETSLICWNIISSICRVSN